MCIIIDDYGSYIHKKGNRFIISKESHQREFSADLVSQILVYKGAAMSSAAIALAVENGIDIVFFDKMGKPFARTYSCKFENAASVRRLQVKAYDNGKGILLITGIIKAKIRNMAILLEILAKDRNNPQLKDMAGKIKISCEKLEFDENIDISRKNLMGIEGEAARQYFSALKYVLPEEAYLGGISGRLSGTGRIWMQRRAGDMLPTNKKLPDNQNYHLSNT